MGCGVKFLLSVELRQGQVCLMWSWGAADKQLGAISIDANRGNADEPWRLDRPDLLRRILQYHIDTFLGEKARVTHLYDHKGSLAVNWDGTPTQEQQELLAGFWENVFWEPLIPSP